MKQTYLYPIIIEPCEEGGYFARCPTIQGVHAEGETYAETLETIESVIQKILTEEPLKERQKVYAVPEPLPAFQVMLPITQ